jgi:hypothetical protein
MKNIIIYIIFILIIIFLLMNIKIRNDKIWQQTIEIEDLKEQIHILSMSKERGD